MKSGLSGNVRSLMTRCGHEATECRQLDGPIDLVTLLSRDLGSPDVAKKIDLITLHSQLFAKTLAPANEFKRRQLPPTLIISRNAIGIGRRRPVTHRYHRPTHC